MQHTITVVEKTYLTIPARYYSYNNHLKNIMGITIERKLSKSVKLKTTTTTTATNHFIDLQKSSPNLSKL